MSIIYMRARTHTQDIYIYNVYRIFRYIMCILTYMLSMYIYSRRDISFGRYKILRASLNSADN